MTNVVRPTRWGKLSQADAERLIREIALDTSNIIFGDHSFERINEREINIDECIRILREGYVEPTPTINGNGDWEFIVSKKIRGERAAGLATIILRNNNKVFIKTVMWRDL